MVISYAQMRMRKEQNLDFTQLILNRQSNTI